MTSQRTLIPGLVVLFVVFSFVTQAQTIVGLRAGVHFSGIRVTDATGKHQDTGMIPRVQAGLTVDIPLAMGLYLQPAALYVGKGFKQDGGWLAAADQEFQAAVSYVEVPLTLLYKLWTGAGNLMVGAGPYVGYGLGGTWEAEGQVMVGDIPLGNDYEAVIFRNDVADGEYGSYLYGKPWDYGANVMVGYQFSPRFSMQLQGQFGVANLAPDVDGTAPEGSVRNKGYSLTIGYGF
ncbi:porin family protein [Parapedobacter sp.]